MPELEVSINARRAVRGAARVTRALGSISRAALSVVTTALNPLNSAIALVGSGAAAIGVTKIADAYTTMAAQLEYATGTVEDAERIQQQLYDISKKTGTQMNANSDTFVKLQQASAMTNLTMEENIEVLGAISGLMVKTGTSGAQASAAMLQLSQALTSGKLAGDEFRSMAENAPGVLNALAKAINVPRSELKKWATEGKLDSKTLGDAFLQIARSGEVAFEELPQTAAKGWNAVVLAFENAWDKINDDTGFIGMLHDGLQNIATWIEENTDVISNWIQNFVDKMIEAWPEISSFFNGIYDGFITVFDYLYNNWDTITNWVDDFVDGFLYLQEQLEPVMDWMIEQLKRVVRFLQVIASIGGSIISGDFEGLGGKAIEALATGADIFTFGGVTAASELGRDANEYLFGDDETPVAPPTEPTGADKYKPEWFPGENESLRAGGNVTINNFNTKQSKSDMIDITLMQQRTLGRI